MPYLNDFLTVALIGILAAISPGPDFVIVTQNSLQQGKRAGLFTALGVALGCLVHVTYCVIGIGMIVAESVTLFTLLKYLGAGYLIYIGFKGLTTRHKTVENISISGSSCSEYSSLQAIKKGFLVNLLNPKATLFFLSIFSQIIDPLTPRFIQALIGIEVSIIGFCWFSILAWILTVPVLKKKLISVQHYVEKLLGALLILFGLRIATINL